MYVSIQQIQFEQKEGKHTQFLISLLKKNQKEKKTKQNKTKNCLKFEGNKTVYLS